MSVTRIGAMLQPASASGGNFKHAIKQVIAGTEKAAELMAALLAPASVIAVALGLWRLAADLEWTETFPISNGIFSHWLVWIAIAIGLNLGAALITSKAERNGKASEEN